MISGAMIVREAAKTVRAALESARSACDEVVVLDTGSTDGTLEVLRDLAAAWRTSDGAQLFVHEWAWRDDFSAARNEVQARCAGDWIVVVDSDEVLDPGNLRETIGKLTDDFDGCAVRLLCEGDRGAVDRVWQVRAYRKARGVWMLPVHNQLTGIRRAARTSAVIRTSYRGDLARRMARSVPMLEKFHREHPEDLHGPFMLAHMHAATENWREALRWATVSTSLCKGEPGEELVWVIRAQATHALHGIDLAESALRDGIARYPDAPDLRYLAITLAVARWAKVASDARRAHRCDLSTLRGLPSSPEEWQRLQGAIDALDLGVQLVHELDTPAVPA